MKTSEITVRDPYVLLHNDKYYLYATRSESCWGPMDGWDVYVSDDLEEWSEPHEIFHREPGFEPDQNYWAPECYEHNGELCFVSTLGYSDDRKKGIHLFKSDSPMGPFRYVSRLTPEDEECIDGTVYEENGEAYLVYSHTLQDVPDGDMCAVRLSDDWESAAGPSFKLFSAGDAPWNNPVPFAKAEFGIEGDAFFSDGPCLRRLSDGSLVMLWSSWAERGYSVGIARSSNGSILGEWSHDNGRLVEDAGHGMLFEDKTGQLLFCCHAPNDFFHEHPSFTPVEEQNGTLALSH